MFTVIFGICVCQHPLGENVHSHLWHLCMATPLRVDVSQKTCKDPKKVKRFKKNKKTNKPLEKFHTSQLQIHFHVNAVHLNIGETSLCSPVSNRLAP